MTCGTVESGNRFLVSTLDYLACTGGTLGSGGYQSLASAPVLSSLLLASLTLFIATIGIRLMFGWVFDFGDAAIAATKVGFVIMLATSWPAVQTLIFGPIARGPSEMIERLGGGPDLSVRLQRIDDGIVALTSLGTGKLDIRVGQTATGEPAASAFSGEATNESLGFSVGRILLLTGVFVSLGGVLLASGLLIALVPLFVGFLLFDTTRSLFLGWVRSMAFLFFAGIVVPVVLIIEANVMEPWMQRLIAERQQYLATPGAPIELIALTSTFALLLALNLWLLAKACFYTDLQIRLRSVFGRQAAGKVTSVAHEKSSSRSEARFSEVSRASHLASVLDIAARREEVTATSIRGTVAATHKISSDRLDPVTVRGTGRRPQPREAGSRSRRDER